MSAPVGTTPDATAAPSPRANPDLLGHETAEAELLEAWNSGRMHHAWLIGGPGGVGKATLAYRFARFVLAQTAEIRGGNSARPGEPLRRDPPLPPAATAGGWGDGGLFGALPLGSATPSPGHSPGLAKAPGPVVAEADPPFPARPEFGAARTLAVAPDHPAFRLVRSGAHPDLLVVERRFDEKRGRMKLEIPVDEVRAATSFLRHTSSGGWKVVVIDGAESLNINGHNALLKILEEPPARALLLLTTETPGGLLPTIRSRCRRLTLAPLPEATVLTLVQRWQPKLAEADQRALARLAEGRIGQALALAEAGGLTLCREMVTLFSSLPALDLVAAHGFAERLARKGEDGLWDTATDLMLWWLRRLARAVACGTCPPPLVPEEEPLLARLLALPPGQSGLDRWLRVWEKATEQFARTDDAALDRRQVALNVLLAIAAAAR